MPVALKIIFGCLDIWIGLEFSIAVLMPGNDIVQQLFGSNTQCKKQKHYSGCETSYDLASVQFLLPCCKSMKIIISTLKT